MIIPGYVTLIPFIKVYIHTKEKRTAATAVLFGEGICFFLWGVAKKLYNVLGGFYINKYTTDFHLCLHFSENFYIKMFLFSFFAKFQSIILALYKQAFKFFTSDFFSH